MTLLVSIDKLGFVAGLNWFADDDIGIKVIEDKYIVVALGGGEWKPSREVRAYQATDVAGLCDVDDAASDLMGDCKVCVGAGGLQCRRRLDWRHSFGGPGVFADGSHVAHSSGDLLREMLPDPGWTSVRRELGPGTVVAGLDGLDPSFDNRISGAGVEIDSEIGHVRLGVSRVGTPDGLRCGEGAVPDDIVECAVGHPVGLVALVWVNKGLRWCI